MQKEVQSSTESLPWHPMVPKIVQDDSQTPPMILRAAFQSDPSLPNAPKTQPLTSTIPSKNNRSQ